MCRTASRRDRRRPDEATTRAYRQQQRRLVVGAAIVATTLVTGGLAIRAVRAGDDPADATTATEMEPDTADTSTRAFAEPPSISSKTDVAAPSVTSAPTDTSAVPTIEPLWQRFDEAHLGSDVPTDGHNLLADGERVYTADGFTGPTISALSIDTGKAIWSRSDLGDETGTFLQLVIDYLLVVSAYHGPVTALASTDGADRWQLSLPDRYGARRAGAVDGMIVLATEASYEGDTRAPIVVAVDAESGTELWRTPLAEGTDLQWGGPAIGPDLVVVQATPSHPGSAPGNVAHALDPSTGEIVWEVQLGGTQGFDGNPPLLGGDTVYLLGPNHRLVAVDRATGEVRWGRSGTRALALTADGDLVVATSNGIAFADPVDRTAAVRLVVPHLSAEGFIGANVTDGVVVVITTSRALAIDATTEEVIWQWQPPAPRQVWDAAIGDGTVAVSTTNRTITLLPLDAG